MNTYPIVDADAHMFEPPDLWTKRIDAPFRDRAPRIVEGLNGKKGLFFVCEGLPPFRVSGAFAAGQKFDRSFPETGMESAPAGGRGSPAPPQATGLAPPASPNHGSPMRLSPLRARENALPKA